MNHFLKFTTFSTVLLLLVLPATLEAQQWSRFWKPGQLILLDGDTLTGELRYDIVNDAVQIRLEDDRIHSYSGKKLLTFSIEEHPRRAVRRFYSLPYQVRGNYQAQRLFEVLYEGKLTLLCRPYMEHLVDVAYEEEEESGKKKQDPVYEYYFLQADGSVHLYRPRLGRLLSIMSSRHREIRSYMQDYHLRYDQMRDLVRITAYYNALPAAADREKNFQPE
ncbi:hypothetical protein [Cesiribacter andamanensis]|uniref:Uncharacterized protein n=1 Tax=Cesiribacter andamanensis AMV16 TaxID=1279009 RepID=M7NR08_9BACT|nr:hypothetical protein [Cesiribacter andamanensis]EMR00939.1 hypothetical protein ADICEAN_03934 [Cesiribacter andamanensis AMV16]